MNNNQNQNWSTGSIIDIQGNETTGRMMRPVAYIKSDFTSKFGIPRQSGLADLEAEIHFYPEYQNPEAVRGLEEYSYLWLIWEFSRSIRKEWSPTVRPPKLGGNTRVGVFATRSPFRPNPIGLSSVQLTGITLDPQDGPVIHIQGADLLDGTAIYDIKPYIPFADCHPDAAAGFVDEVPWHELSVDFPDDLAKQITPGKLDGLVEVLRQDPRRAGSKHEPKRVYRLAYAGQDIGFTVDGDTLHVVEIREGRNW